ncbi:MAG: CoA-binding protein [Acidimicrobiia bacterium]|nr:CoA-binding protein [Acidimicrobiia bacterium]NNK92668.1 CoA-binding protein [Acidimicrobiia bacterium]
MVLRDYRVWAVVGASPNPMRPSHGVAGFLKDAGYRMIPVNPTLPEGSRIHDEPVYADLASIPETVDVVDIFRRSELAGAHVDEAIAVGARAVWMQLGVIDEAAAQRAEAAGLDVVMDRCPKIEYPRFF